MYSTILARQTPLTAIQVVVDVTNILWFHEKSSWGQTSSTLLLSSALDNKSDIRLVSAFKHTYYRLLDLANRPPASNPHSVFVCTDDPAAAATVIGLVNKLSGICGLYAGDLQYSRIIELLSQLRLAQLERDNFGTLFSSGWRFGE
jgi:predicted dinucleotide-binding enzyme